MKVLLHQAGNSLVNVKTESLSGQVLARGWVSSSSYQLDYVLEGQGERQVGDSTRQFSRGDFFLLPPQIPSRWLSVMAENGSKEKEPRSINVQFGEKDSIAQLEKIPDLAWIAELLSASSQGLYFRPENSLRAEYTIANVADTEGLERFIGFIYILDILYKEKKKYRICESNYSVEKSSIGNNKLIKVIDYLERNYHSNIKQADIASMIGMSPQGFSRSFKSATGYTFVKYINAIRIKKACELLKASNDDISKIASACGYENISYFNRRFFEEKNICPRDYRNKFKA